MIRHQHPPRALSANIDDIRFDPDFVGRADLAIWLDGVPQKYVLTYDMDEGFIDRIVLDDAGNLLMNDARDEIRHERVEGVVTALLTSATLDQSRPTP